MALRFLAIISKQCIMSAAGLLLSLQAMAQMPDNLRFDNLGITDGLSQSTINGILQDKQGFMWFATDENPPKQKQLLL